MRRRFPGSTIIFRLKISVSRIIETVNVFALTSRIAIQILLGRCSKTGTGFSIWPCLCAFPKPRFAEEMETNMAKVNCLRHSEHYARLKFVTRPIQIGKLPSLKLYFHMIKVNTDTFQNHQYWNLNASSLRSKSCSVRSEVFEFWYRREHSEMDPERRRRPVVALAVASEVVLK